MTTPKRRTLTKSRFKLACECPTKLYFTSKPIYGNTKLDNAFLEALAQGGSQVGELAKLYYPGGHEVFTLDAEAAVQETKAKIAKTETLTLYEAAFTHADLLVRVDIFVKNGNEISLYEVKSKSFRSEKEDDADAEEDFDGVFYDKRLLKSGVYQIKTPWRPYLCDIAFQAYVVKNQFPTARRRYISADSLCFSPSFFENSGLAL